MEEFLRKKSPFYWALATLLLPFSAVYCLISSLLFLKKPLDLGVAIVSVGNLTLGGLGKTPVSMAIARHFKDFSVAIVLRGYKRKSKGLRLVAHDFKILTDVQECGDEAFLYAKTLANLGVTIIVSEDRQKGVLKAKELGAKLVLLDDGFRHKLKKLDILIRPQNEPKLRLCLPSGEYRLAPFFYTKANLVIQETIDFTRITQVLNPSDKMALVTAIANPKRLDEHLKIYEKNIVARFYFADHYSFKEQELRKILKETGAKTLLVTQKDAVKIKGFNLSILDLRVELSPIITQKIQDYIKENKW